MLLGYEGEREIIEKWEKQFKIPIFPRERTRYAAAERLKLEVLSALDTSRGDTARPHYFTAAGFDVLGIERLPVPGGGRGYRRPKFITM